MPCIFCKDLTEIVPLEIPVAQPILIQKEELKRPEIHIWVSKTGAIHRRDYYNQKTAQIIERNDTHIVVKWPSENNNYSYQSPYTVVYEIIKDEGEGNYLTVTPLIKWENTRGRK